MVWSKKSLKPCPLTCYIIRSITEKKGKKLLCNNNIWVPKDDNVQLVILRLDQKKIKQSFLKLHYNICRPTSYVDRRSALSRSLKQVLSTPKLKANSSYYHFYHQYNQHKFSCKWSHKVASTPGHFIRESPKSNPQTTWPQPSMMTDIMSLPMSWIATRMHLISSI